MVESPYFKPEEFNCKCCDTGSQRMDTVFLQKLFRARQIAKVVAQVAGRDDCPFVIASGYRCLEHNEAVGGVIGSAHTRGCGVDIKATSSRLRFLILGACLLAGFRRVGLYEDFIHVDRDLSKPGWVLWLGKK